MIQFLYCTRSISRTVKLKTRLLHDSIGRIRGSAQRIERLGFSVPRV